jgi:amicyanin
MKDFSFQPAEVKIKKGGTVTWTNTDSVRHDIIFGNSSSPLLGKGESYTKKFDEEGVYDYYCGPHPSMKGKVNVI